MDGETKPGEFWSDLLTLLKKHSYKKGDFTLASGKKSSYFIDCKQTLLTANGHWLVGRLLFDTIDGFQTWEKVKINGIAAVALGGCSIASAVSTISATYIYNDNKRLPELDVLYIRKEAKEHGTKNLIEGTLEKGSNIILLEDTITTGGSSINALAILKDAGYNPVAVMSVVDRLEGGSENISKNFDIPVISLFTIKEIADD